MRMFGAVGRAVLCASLMGFANTTWAQVDYPAKPVRMVVGFGAGGPTDIVARLVAQHLEKDLKQSFIVENKPGAAGNIASAEVIRAAPDGYTVLLAGLNITINPAIMDNIKFDSRKDLKPVMAVATAPTVLVVRNTFPAKTFKAFVEEVKANPGKYNSAAQGASPVLATEMFSQLTSSRVEPVPYTGAAPAMIDLIAGHVDMSFATLGSVLPHIKSGKVRALALGAAERSDWLPDVPTFIESGVDAFKLDSWAGVFVPAGTPDSVVKTLEASLAKLVENDAFAASLAEAGMTPVKGSTPQAFTQQIDVETERYRKLGDALKAKTPGAQTPAPKP